MSVKHEPSPVNRCVRCGDRPEKVRCALCGAPLLALPERYVQRSVSVANWSQVGAAVGVTGCFLAAFAGGVVGLFFLYSGSLHLLAACHHG